MDFKKIVFEDHILVSVNVLYFLPDYKNVLNEFIWQTLDVKPRYPRIHRFLHFWQEKIEAKIKEVIITDVKYIPNQWRNGIIINLK